MQKSFAALLAAASMVAYSVAFAQQPGEDAETTIEKPLAVTGNAEAGQSKAAACAACHGADGNSPNAEWPKLADQHVDYTVEQLQRYKSGERQNAVMQGMAASLSEQDMRDIAAFYASRSVQPGVANEDLVQQGERVYRGGNKETGLPACIACHGPTGAGVPGSGFAAIGGQHARYTLDQLRRYAAGERRDPKDIMNRIAQRLGEEEMRAVSSYIEGLHMREGALRTGD